MLDEGGAAPAAPTSSSGSSRPTAARDRGAVGDIEVVPRPHVEYRGAPFEEMDVDAVLTKARVALVDELAHTNVPARATRSAGRTSRSCSTRDRRHLDRQRAAPRVAERRRRADHRRQAARDRPRRRRPRADQIELVDMTPEALRRRMAHGNVYPAERMTPRSRTTSGRETSGPCASSRCCGSPTGSTSRSRSTGATTASTSLGDAGARAGRTHRGGPEATPGPARGAHGRAGAGRAPRRSRGRRRARTPTSGSADIGPSLDELGGRLPRGRRRDVAAALVKVAAEPERDQLVLGGAAAHVGQLTSGSVINDVIRRPGDGIDVHVIADPAAGADDHVLPTAWSAA